MKIVITYSDQEFESEVNKEFGPESSTMWSYTPTHNRIFLQAQEQYCKDLLLARGHVFLNQVYDLIGLPRTSLGAVLGWAEGDIVEFGTIHGRTDGAVSLCFNPSGVIVDKI